mmetsp:Transcript_10197/g.28462  ORF Transcript_10197/g.28462 Transcript_10197/m.28462 type:complete len:370 (-) Transcript_10197:990-2099(-)
MASVLVACQRNCRLQELGQHGDHCDATADDGANVDQESAPPDLLCVVRDPDRVNVHAEEHCRAYQLIGHEGPCPELIAVERGHRTPAGYRRWGDSEVVLEGEGLGALEAVQRLRRVQQFASGGLDESEGVDSVTHVLRGRCRLIEVRDVRGCTGPVGADVEVARHLVCVEKAVDPAALAALLAPAVGFTLVHTEDWHVQGIPEIQCEGPAAVAVAIVVIVPAREPAGLRLRFGLSSGLAFRQGAGAVGACVGRRVLWWEARPRPGGKAITLAAPMSARADPALGDSVLLTPGPPLARSDLLADSRTTFEAAATELVGLLAIVVPTAFLCPVRRQVDHEGLSNVVAVDYDVLPHAIWPCLGRLGLVFLGT